MATSLPLSDSEQPLEEPELQGTEDKPDSQKESDEKTDKTSQVIPVLPPKPIGLNRSQVTVDEHGSTKPTVPPKPLPRKPLHDTGEKASTGPPEVAPRTKIYSNTTELLSSDKRHSFPTQSALLVSQQPTRSIPHTPPELVRTAVDYEDVQPGELDSTKMSRSKKLQFKEIGKAMMLKEFCSQKKTLPCLIKVTQGYTSLCDRYSLGTGQLLVAMELEEIDTVRIKSDFADGTQYDVPLQTDAFTVLPAVAPQYSTEGIIRPLQLLECEILPKVIQVASATNITTVKGRKIQSGALLFPQEVKKKTRKTEKHLLVARLEDGSVVEINSKCGGGFIASRSAADNLSLSTAVQCIKLPFECTLKPLEDDIFCNHVTMESVRKELFLFGVMKVSDGSIQDDVNSFQQLSEVPGNLEISVVVMVPKDEDVLENIYESAQSYYNVKSMSRRTKKKPPIIASVKESALIQSPDHHLLGPYVSLMPTTRTLESHQQYSEIMAASAPPKPPPSKIEYYSKSDVQTPLVSKSKKSKKMVQSRPLPRIPLATEFGVPTQGTTPECPSQVYDSADKIVAQHHNIHSTTGNTTDISRQGTAAILPPDEIVRYSTLPKSADLTAAANIRTLKSLDPIGVLNLLDAMNLSVYKENFQKELIDGEILSEFTEEMFIELGVESSLHRLRLMHVVKGRKGVPDILNKNSGQT